MPKNFTSPQLGGAKVPFFEGAEVVADQEDWIDKSHPQYTKLRQRQPVYRFSYEGKRFYYAIYNGVPEIYSSGTTVISDGFVKSQIDIDILSNWKTGLILKGKDPDGYTRLRADYGTIMHVLFADFLVKPEIPMSDRGLSNYIQNLNVRVSQENLDKLVKENLHEFRKDLLSFASWCIFYKVKPIAIEMMAHSRKWKIATAIDLICYITYDKLGYWGEVYKSGAKKGEPKKTKKQVTELVIVDFKSGKKYLSKTYAIQLACNQMMLKEMFPDIKIDGIYNFAPKDWTGKEPTYTFKEQSDNPVLDELEDVLRVGLKRHNKKKKWIRTYKGALKFGQAVNMRDFFTVIPLDQYLREYHLQIINPVKLFFKDNMITHVDELEALLDSKPVKELKEIARLLSVSWKSKKVFVDLLVEQYNIQNQ